MSTEPRVRAADDLTQLAVWIRERLGAESSDLRACLVQAAEDIRQIAVRLTTGTDAEPERDPDLELWLSNQLARARLQPAGPEDENALRQIAAMEDGSVAEQVAVWLRPAR